jgi:hypothetical protein
MTMSVESGMAEWSASAISRGARTSLSPYNNSVGTLTLASMSRRTGELLGNFPQAFSHIGLVNAAWEISEAALRRAGKPALQLWKGP